jgi:hypothetical protein
MNYRSKRTKQGVIAPLFAFILPVLLIFSAFAINLAWMQLTTTQLKIATDASSHAGGRALSFFQDTDQAIIEMDRYAQLNLVDGQQIVIPQNDAHMQFGEARLVNGKYAFQQHEKSVVDAEDSGVIVNSVRVLAEIDTPLAFAFRTTDSSFNPTRSSITHQKDRDIAMILDKSGSMLEFTNYPILNAVLNNRLNNNQISRQEYNLAHVGDSLRVYKQYYTNNVLNEMGQLADILDANRHPLALAVRESVEYAISMQSNLRGTRHPLNLDDNTPAGNTELWRGRQWYNRYQNGMVETAPTHSRWGAMVAAMNGFFDVLEKTDQQEQVALVVFSSTADAESILTDDYDLLRTVVAEIVPNGGTQIGEGLHSGLREVVDFDGSGEPANSRKFAEKMIVVMTDGTQSPGGIEAKPVAQRFKEQHPEAVIHTVTFGEGATQSAMIEVAEAGGGNHYHANDADELADEFREIANIPPTIFTF